MISIQSQVGAYMASSVSILYIYTLVSSIHCILLDQVLLGTSVLHARHSMHKSWYVHIVYLVNCTKIRYGPAA